MSHRHLVPEGLRTQGNRALAPLAIVASALVLIVAATVVLVGVVAWDLLNERRLLAETQPVAAELEV
jgi:hypothetical protein